MRILSLSVLVVLCATRVLAQQQGPIRASLDSAAADVASAKTDQASPQPTPDAKARPSRQKKNTLFWSGLAVGVAGVTTSTLGLTALRTEHTSTGNAPDNAYQACVAQKTSDPIYATNQCGALKGKNLKLLWSGVAIGGAGAALMIRGRNTTAELSPGLIGVFHRWQF